VVDTNFSHACETLVSGYHTSVSFPCPQALVNNHYLQVNTVVYLLRDLRLLLSYLSTSNLTTTRQMTPKGVSLYVVTLVDV